MKPCGVIRRIDELGRIVLPSDVRKALDLKSGTDRVEIFADGESIVLKKYRASCIFCGEFENTVEFKGQKVCASCAGRINEILKLSEQ